MLRCCYRLLSVYSGLLRLGLRAMASSVEAGDGAGLDRPSEEQKNDPGSQNKSKKPRVFDFSM